MAHVEITYEHNHDCPKSGERTMRRYIVQAEDGTFVPDRVLCGLRGRGFYTELAIVDVNHKGSSL